MEQSKYLGVDIGGTKIALVVGDTGATVFSRVEFPTRVEIGPDKIIQRIVEEGRTLLQQHGVVAAGVSCGGPLDPETGVIYAPPNLPGWDQVPITQILAERWQLPVALQNDANAGALAEWQFGSGRGTRHFIFLTFGTGLGAGLILNGQLYEGANHLAGEVGHWRMAAAGPYAYGKSGSFEAFCSGPGLQRLVQWQAARLASECTRLSTEEITQRALSGDPACREIITACGRKLGEGLALLIDLLNPEKIAMGGMAVRLGELVLAPARAVVKHEALPATSATCQIVAAELGEKIGDVASLCVAMRATPA